MRILLVEDDRMLGDGLQAGLTQAGYAVDWLRDGEAAVTALSTESFAAVVLDLGLPKRDGLSVLQWLRSRHDATPVLILTARDQLADKVRGLDLGADDYVLKPFDLDEIAARLRALVRRAHGHPEPLLTLGEVELNPAARTVRRGGLAIDLTPREFDLLHLLLENADRVLTRRILEEQLYTWNDAVDSNALEVHVHHLRKKLGNDLIRTVRGVGYMASASLPRMTHPLSYSLRRRLAWLLTGSLAAIWLLSALVVYQRAHDEADKLLDAQLTQVADTLLVIAAGGEVEHFVEELHEHRRTPVPIAFEVWHTEDGEAHRLLTSPGHDGFAAGGAAGFSESLHQGEPWRLYAVQDDDAEYRVVVGQAHVAREGLAREIGLSLLIPAALALPLMALAVWWGVGRSLRPVNALAREVGTLDAQALAPLGESTALPNEIAPLRDALNALIRRVTEAFENERRFTADAAHELRTPLAALKVQAQVALRAQSGDHQQHALAQVIAGVDRMAHLVEQLLTLARVDPATQGNVPQPLEPAGIIAEVCADLQPQARRQAQSLVVDATPGCPVAVTAAWLQIALRNLLDNALRYAGEGARIEVHLARSGDDCVISVADDGPGVAPGLRSQLSARFVRGEVEEEGCGLGLSIVARIAALSHATLELGDGLPRADGGHGLAATLRFSSARNQA